MRHVTENDGKRKGRPDTAAGEVLHEIEKAETDVADARERRHRGEAAEAITPNPGAQRDAEEDARDD